MTTPNLSMLLQSGGNRNESRSAMKGSASKQRNRRSVARLGTFLTFLMIFSAIFTAVSYSSSSTSSPLKKASAASPLSPTKSSSENRTGEAKRNSAISRDKFLLPWPATAVNRGLSELLLPSPPEDQSIAIFLGPGCTTPKTDFNFGETVCVVVSNASIGAGQRLVWGHTDGFLARTIEISNTTQTDQLTLTPTSILGGEVVDNKGTWRVSTIDADGAPVAVAYFTIHDPANPTSDLSVYKFVKGVSEVNENTNVSFAVSVSNQGPDTAHHVTLTDVVPNAATFVSLTQDAGSGPLFSCAGSVCTIDELAKGQKATFTAVYLTNGVAGRTLSTYSASVSSDPAELRPVDNTASGELNINVTAVTSTCTLDCSDNINAIANTTVGTKRGAYVTFAAAEPTGDCGAVTATPASGSFFPVGPPTTVTVTSATNGGSCSFTVSVEDVGGNPATISCPPNKEANIASNGTQCQTTVDPGSPTTTGDNVTVTSSRSDGLPLTDPYPVGTTTITWTATSHATPGGNGTGNASCSQTITVFDKILPQISASDQTATADADCQATVPDFTATATVSDNCADRAQMDVTQAPAAGTLVGFGPHTITLTATDEANNSSTATATFTVNDTTPPSITAPAAKTVNADTGSCAASGVALGTPTTADNCSVASVTNNAPASFPLGTTTVTWTVTDGSGHTATATQTVTVVDNQNPTITAPAAKTVNADTGSCAASGVALGTPTTADNCSVASVTNNAPASFQLGTTTVTWTVTDGSGHTATAQQTVTVVDNQKPTITTPANIVVQLPVNSSATSITVSYPSATATDNCAGPITLAYSQASGSTFPVGTTTVTVTATDAHSNSASATFTVTVLYNFTGFFSPVGNLPTLNLVNAGKAVPVKFSLSGDKGLAIFAPLSPASAPLNCETNDPVVDVTETLNAGGSSLSYTPDQYNYVWKTESSWVGTCRQLVVTLKDGSVYRANFKFK